MEKEISSKIVKGSPFTLVKIESKIHVAIGNQMATDETFETFEEAENFVTSKPYQLVYSLAGIMAMHICEEMLNKVNNEKTE